jgi:hypothetical protein
LADLHREKQPAAPGDRNPGDPFERLYKAGNRFLRVLADQPEGSSWRARP